MEEGPAWAQGPDVAARLAACYGAWPHQVEALRLALQRNVILNLPTGTGKTLVACMLLDAYTREGAQGLFVVSGRALIAQQAAYLRGHSRRGLQVAELSAEGQACADPDVVVGTAEAARLALERGRLLPERLAVLVLDEAHYAVGRHPYAELLALLRARGARPRILGLTASFIHGALVDPAGRRDELQETLMGAELIAPHVEGPQAEHRFFTVPWRSEDALEPTSIADFLERTEALLQALRPRFLLGHWELERAVEKEKSRTRGALESLGEMGWHGFMSEGLAEVVGASLANKLSRAEDAAVQAGVRSALGALPGFAAALAECVAMSSPAATTTGKCKALIALLWRLLATSVDQAIVFVERVASACPMARILAAHLGTGVVHVCGVQGMDDATRQRAVDLFRSGSARVLVATTSLEEGLDVPSCRYVVRYDWFASAKSHVQGAGRARHRDAEVYYFENDPQQEQARREVVESVARGPAGEEEPPPSGAAEGFGGAAAAPWRAAGPEASGGAAYTPGVGSGHAWGEESTMWDYSCNASFRGMTCACGTRIHIATRCFGRGRKKKERLYSLEGPVQCPRFACLPDARLTGVDPVTGVLNAEGQ